MSDQQMTVFIESESTNIHSEQTCNKGASTDAHSANRYLYKTRWKKVHWNDAGQLGVITYFEIQSEKRITIGV